MSIPHRICFALFLILVLHFSTNAQSATATLGGLVSDETGARLPDSNVEVINISTGVAQLTTTNREGYFTFPLLSPGRYRLVIRHEGFANVEVKEIVLAVSDRRTLALKLKVGPISETVNIEGVDVIQTDSSSVSTLIDRDFVSKLPLNGRSFHSLLSLVPGVVLTKTDNENQGQFSVNGQRADSNNFTVDGVSANFGITSIVNSGGSIPATSALGGVSSLVSVDALEEFSVQTSTYAAEFGRYSGGQISVITRSGTNDFHGSVFEYFRNEALDANDWFANRNGFSRAALRQNDFGGVLGGPIIPRKTFFFFSYEGLQLRQPRVIDGLGVPTVEVRRSAPPALQQLLNALPLPNVQLPTEPGVGTFSATYSDPSTLNATSLRLDHRVSSAFSIFGRFNIAPSDTSSRWQGGPSTVNQTKYRANTFTVGITNSFSSRTQHELRANYSTSDRFVSSHVDTFGSAVVPPDSLLFPASLAPGSARFVFSSGLSGFVVGHSESHQRQFNIIDNVAVIHSKHQFKFGIDYRRLMPLISAQPYTQNVQTTLDRIPLGLAQTVEISSRLGQIYPRYTNLSVYGQDNWKITERLTLNYGLRWELNPSPTEKNGNMPFSLTGLENSATISLGTRTSRLWKTSYTDFAPRIGFSYLLNPKLGKETLIKGGVGVFYDLGMAMAGASLGGEGFPYSSVKRFFDVPWPLSATDAAPRPPNLDPPYGYIGVMDPQLKSPRTYQWSGGITQAIGTNQALTVTYVGAAGRRLKSSHFWENPNPKFFTVELVGNHGFSDYHALQAQFQRRLSKNLQVLASYTWSHSIDTASDDFYDRQFTDDQINLSDDKGNSDFDVRHSFSSGLTYEVPDFVPGKVSGWLFHNWAIDAKFLARTPMPMKLFGISNFGFYRPDINQGVPIRISDPDEPGEWRLNWEAFSPATSLRQGTLGRNVIRGFPAVQLDLSLRRSFAVNERVKVELMADCFNILNHPNFADPFNIIFGQFFDQFIFGKANQMLASGMGIQTSAGSTGFNEIYQVGGPRNVQLAIKIEF